jgi:hypothetical protein
MKRKEDYPPLPRFFGHDELNTYLDAKNNS